MSEFNRLKTINVDDLENAIAKAVSDLIGNKYDCTVSEITYGVIEDARFAVKISLHNELLNKTSTGNK